MMDGIRFRLLDLLAALCGGIAGASGFHLNWPIFCLAIGGLVILSTQAAISEKDQIARELAERGSENTPSCKDCLQVGGA
jgi:hypothetical protein